MVKNVELHAEKKFCTPDLGTTEPKTLDLQSALAGFALAFPCGRLELCCVT